MDTLNHAAQAFVIVSIGEALTEVAGVGGGGISLSVGIGGALVGAAPDVIGWIEKKVKRDKNAWNWYGTMHSIEALTIAAILCCWGLFIGPWWITAFSLAYILHLLEDLMTHVELGAKRNWYPPDYMWRDDFWKAVAWCKWNWIAWAITIATYFIVRVLS